MTNKEFFGRMKGLYRSGLSRDKVVAIIKNEYCDGLVFKDDYDQMEYIVKLCNTWKIFS